LDKRATAVNLVSRVHLENQAQRARKELLDCEETQGLLDQGAQTDCKDLLDQKVLKV